MRDTGTPRSPREVNGGGTGAPQGVNGGDTGTLGVSGGHGRLCTPCFSRAGGHPRDPPVLPGSGGPSGFQVLGWVGSPRRVPELGGSRSPQAPTFLAWPPQGGPQVPLAPGCPHVGSLWSLSPCT